MRWGLLAFSMCTACGRINFAPLDPSISADAAADAAFPTGPFGPPVPVDELNTTSSEDDISLTGDLLEIYFMTSRTGTNALHRATRSLPTDPWSPPVEVTGLGADVNNPRISNDGLALYFASDRTPNVGLDDLWFATRPDRGAAWDTPQALPGINTAGNEIEPWLLDTRLVAYFTRSNTGIMRAERGTPSDPFGPAVVVSELEAPGYQGTAWVDERELLVGFHSDSTPDRELFYATRTARTEPWSAPMLMTELNSSASDADVWIAPDGHTVFFVSTRTGNYDVYMATR